MSVYPLTILIIMSVFSGIAAMVGAGLDSYTQQQLARGNYNAQVGINKAQIESAEKINQQNIDMQRETNALQVFESEKAYQRSRVDAQVAQFVSAGFSEQQARAIVAGAANPGAYSPATLTAPQADPSAISAAYDNLSAGVQQSYQMQSDAAHSMASAITAAGSVADSLFQSLSDPTGGSIGALVADDAIKELTTHLHELSPAHRSLYGLQQLADSPDCPEWLKSFKDSDAWNRCINSLYGRKTLSEFFRQATSVSMDNYALDAADKANQLASIRVVREDLGSQLDNLEIIAKTLENDTQIKIQPHQVRLAIAQAQSQAEFAELNYELFQNPEYRQNWWKRMCKNEVLGLLSARLAEIKLNGQIEWLEDSPENALMISLSELFDNVGFTQTDYSAMAAWGFAMKESGFASAKYEETKSSVVDFFSRVYESYKQRHP